MSQHRRSSIPNLILAAIAGALLTLAALADSVKRGPQQLTGDTWICECSPNPPAPSSSTGGSALAGPP